MSPLWDRLQGFEVDVQVIDGHDPVAVREALLRDQPRLRIIVLRTVKGRGVSFMENRMDSHYLPLTEPQFHLALKELESL
jgi:transketolase